jgi:Type IV leader peptidase family./Archaeal Peptidase A24 C-terminus Type II.
MEIIDLISATLSLLFLAYASYSDLKTRKVDNKVWIMAVGCGLVLLLFKIEIYCLVSIVFMILFAFLVYYLGVFLSNIHVLRGGIYGGADAKAIISLSILMPTWPFFSEYFPVFFSLSAVLNGAIISLLVPLAMFIYNAWKKKISFPQCFIAIPVKGKVAEEKWWIYAKKNGKTYVTPKIPFILFLLLGYIVSLVYGDLVSPLLFYLLGF